MNLFALSDLKALQGAHSSDPAYDFARQHARNQLVWLHEKIYGEMRARRWDVYFRPEWSFSQAHVSDDLPMVDCTAVKIYQVRIRGSFDAKKVWRGFFVL